MSPVSFTFEALGIQHAKARFNRLGAAAINLEPAWVEMLEFFFYIEDSIFHSQGRRGGGSWAQLTEGWLSEKARLGWDPRINFATWELYDAMTLLGAPGQIVDIGPQDLVFGTNLPQAGPSQAHRPFIKPTEQDKLEMAELIKHHFRKAWDAAA